MSKWPGACYQKAHYHGPGAVLLGLEGDGYVIMWPKDLGLEPSLQYFGESGAPYRAALQRRIHPTGFQLAAKLHEDGTTTSIKKGGRMIEYADEDPQFAGASRPRLKKRAGIRTCLQNAVA